MTTATTTAAGRLRPRRSCLAVPGSSPRFLEKAQSLPGDWGGKIRVVRVNDWTTHWTYRGIEAQIENARGLMNVDAIAAASPRLETIIFGPADFKMALVMSAKGRAAGMQRTTEFEPPQE